MGGENITDELQLILDSVPYEITVKDLDNNYLFVNKRFLICVGCTENTDYNTEVSEYWNSDDYKEIKKLDKEALKKNKGIFSERNLRNSNNIERWFKIYKAPIVFKNKKCILTLSYENTFNKKIVNLMAYELERDSHDILGYQDVLYNNKSNTEVSDAEYNERITILCKNLCGEVQASYITIYLYNEKDNALELYSSTHDKDNFGKTRIELGNKKFIKFAKTRITINQKMLHQLYCKELDKLFDLKIYEIKYGNNIIGIMNIYYNRKHDIQVEQNDLIESTCYKFGLIFQNKIIKRQLKEEERKKAKYKKALDMEILKTEFFAGISHEFRTPLNIIITSVQLINSVLDGCECEMYKKKILKNIGYIRQNSNRLIRLVNNILDISKIDFGYQSVKYTNCNIVEIVEDIVMSVSEYIKTSKRKIIFDTDEEEIITACDLDKIERIMLNLLSNAIKFSNDNAEIFVKLKLNEEKDTVTISVWDDGIPIKEEDSERVFDRFVQLDNLLNRPCEGSGIGLFIVKSLVEMQGGKVWVNNCVEKGTEIDFTLPIKTIVEEDNERSIRTRLYSNKVEACNIEFSDIYSL